MFLSLFRALSSHVLPRLFPEVVVLLAKLLVEPVVDERVAKVVDEGQVHPLVVQSEDEDQVEADVCEKETDCDCGKHLHDQHVLRLVVLNRCSRICRTSGWSSSTEYCKFNMIVHVHVRHVPVHAKIK